jgi:alkanesulfonate monooxygenase SsuD/methylene tetrahydromethanopterin reductase-like flavin-dependent oxidoreductase (luciferase family)
MGSLSMKSLERVVEYCDGWYPVGAEYDALARRVRALREAAERAGRPFDKIDLAVAAMTPNEDSCKRLRDLGFSHLVLGVASEPRDKALAALDKRASLVSKLR